MYKIKFEKTTKEEKPEEELGKINVKESFLRWHIVILLSLATCGIAGIVLPVIRKIKYRKYDNNTGWIILIASVVYLTWIFQPSILDSIFNENKAPGTYVSIQDQKEQFVDKYLGVFDGSDKNINNSITETNPATETEVVSNDNTNTDSINSDDTSTWDDGNYYEDVEYEDTIYNEQYGDFATVDDLVNACYFVYGADVQSYVQEPNNICEYISVWLYIESCNSDGTITCQSEDGLYWTIYNYTNYNLAVNSELLCYGQFGGVFGNGMCTMDVYATATKNN